MTEQVECFKASLKVQTINQREALEERGIHILDSWCTKNIPGGIPIIPLGRLSKRVYLEPFVRSYVKSSSRECIRYLDRGVAPRLAWDWLGRTWLRHFPKLIREGVCPWIPDNPIRSSLLQKPSVLWIAASLAWSTCGWMKRNPRSAFVTGANAAERGTKL